MKPVTLQACCAGLMIAVASAGALAQAPAQPELRPPTPQQQPPPPSVLNFLALLLIVVVCAGAASIPSKRGHQD